LDQIERLKAERKELDNVTLLHSDADDFSRFDDGSFDTVIINSVVQYFPDIDYLLRVLDGAVRVTKAGGCVFIGDIRSLPLLDAYHASIQFDGAPANLTLAQLDQRVSQGIKAEEELVVDPDLFHHMAERNSTVADVRVLLKRGSHHNEMTKFRYDVIISIGDTERPCIEVPWLDWRTDRPGPRDIGTILTGKKPEIIGFRNVTNARLQRDTAILAQLSGAGIVGELARTLEGSDLETIDPEELYRLESETLYDVDIGWFETTAADCYDVVFRRRPAAAPSEMQAFTRTGGNAARPERQARPPRPSHAGRPKGRFAGCIRAAPLPRHATHLRYLDGRPRPGAHRHAR
jgi:hypothetical protein